MATTAQYLTTLAQRVHRHRGLIVPVAAASLILAVLVPLPPTVMDVLLSANIALAAVILLTAIYVDSPLEFSVFPSLLLGATLFRLVLNMATTRLILTAGAGGRSFEEAQYAAGHVVWAFSRFVTAGSLTVGVILFVILAVVQFVVITKGAARISEVAARFMLDAMPGKQMTIDADLNAGLIDEAEACRRRERVGREADFYGAMDGASKFLRGDAVAAVLITLVNLLGGMYIGVVQYGWSFDRTVDLFTRLTIGDGLVAQVPAVIVSMSAALLVTRSTARTRLGEEVISQLTSRPIALAITAGFLAVLAFTSLPKAPLLLLGAGCAGLAILLSRTARVEEQEAATPATLPRGPSAKVVRPTAAFAVDPLRIGLGFSLIRLADAEAGAGLLDRIASLRRQIGEELGLLVPPVKIGDDMRLDSRSYAIKIRGVEVAAGQLYPKKLLAMRDDDDRTELAGLPTTEPASGAPALWISRTQRNEAERLGYAIVEPVAVLVTHFGQVVRAQAAELLTRRQVTDLLDGVRQVSAALVTEVDDRFGAGVVQKVLQNLLRERVPIRDLEAILEAMCDAPASTSDPEALTERVRESLRRVLTQQYCERDGKLWCVSLAAGLEEELSGTYLSGGGPGAHAPQRTRRIATSIADGVSRLTRQGRRPVLVCDPQIRRSLRRLIEPVMPELAVLGYNEIDAAEIQSVGTVGIE